MRNYYDVLLNAWATPVHVQADTAKRAKELALSHYPKCDCCGEPTSVKSVTKWPQSRTVGLYETIVMGVKK